MISDQPTRTIPHRDPFLWVSRLIERNAEGTQGIVELDINEKLEIFKGHFPGNPIFPGVLQVEAAAQAALWVFKGVLPEGARLPTGLFVSVEGFKFKKPVTPPSVLTLKVHQIQKRGSLFKWGADIFIGDTLVSCGTCWLYMVSDPSVG